MSADVEIPSARHPSPQPRVTVGSGAAGACGRAPAAEAGYVPPGYVRVSTARVVAAAACLGCGVLCLAFGCVVMLAESAR